MKNYNLRCTIIIISLLFPLFNFAQQATNKVALEEYYDGAKAMRKGHYDVALNHLNTAVSLIGDKPKLRYQIMKCHDKLNDFPAVIKDGNQMKRMSIPTSDAMYRNYRSLYANAEEKTAARSVDNSSYERVFSKLLIEGEQHFERGEYNDALEKFKEAKYMEESLELNDPRARVGYAGCKASLDWEKIKSNLIPITLRKFIIDNPTGSLSTEAKSKLAELETKAYVLTQEKSTLEQYNKFLEKFPESSHAGDVKKQRDDLVAYSRLGGREEELKTFMTQHPTSLHYSLAKSRLQKIYTDKINIYAEKEKRAKYTMIALVGSTGVLFLGGAAVIGSTDWEDTGELGTKGWVGVGMMIASTIPAYAAWNTRDTAGRFRREKKAYQAKLDHIAFSPIINPYSGQYGFYASIRF